jgi:hypothetical protein
MSQQEVVEQVVQDVYRSTSSFDKSAGGTYSDAGHRGSALKLTSMLRCNHITTFLLYFTGSVFWLMVVVRIMQDDVTHRVDFFVYSPSTEHGPLPPAAIASTELLSCPVRDATGYLAVGGGKSGFCASTIDRNGAASAEPLHGCDVDISFLALTGVDEAAGFCQDLCQCAQQDACLGFSVGGNGTSMTICRLHTVDTTCANLLPAGAFIGGGAGDDSGELQFTASANASTRWSAAAIGIHAVDGSPHAKCYTKRNTCTSDCLGITCDEMSAQLGLSCG